MRNSSELNENIIYQELGKSIVIFQYLESLIYEISHFTLDVNRKQSSRAAIDGLSFSKLRDISEVILAEAMAEQKIEHAKILSDKYHKLMQEVREISNMRNRLVHSVYLHLESGDKIWKIIKSYSSIKTSGPTGPHRKIEHEELSNNSFENFQIKCANAYMGLGLFKTQLYHILHKPC